MTQEKYEPLSEAELVAMDGKSFHRFTTKYVIRDTGCWEWVASHTPDGYGQFYLDGKSRGAHRVAYEHWVGPIPDGMQIDHLCRNPPCVNPEHLEPVTFWENIYRGNSHIAERDQKTHCPKGHPYDENNTRWAGRLDNKFRQCRTCKQEYDRNYRRRTKQKRDEYKKAYYWAHRDECLATWKRWSERKKQEAVRDETP